MSGASTSGLGDCSGKLGKGLPCVSGGEGGRSLWKALGRDSDSVLLGALWWRLQGGMKMRPAWLGDKEKIRTPEKKNTDKGRGSDIKFMPGGVVGVEPGSRTPSDKLGLVRVEPSPPPKKWACDSVPV